MFFFRKTRKWRKLYSEFRGDDGDLYSSNKPILFLSFLFLESDLLFEVGILDDLVQSRGNLRVQHFKILEFLAHNWSRWLQFIHWINHLHLFHLHYMASEGKWEQVVNWLLNLIFQHKNDDGEESIKLKFRYLLSLLSNNRTLWNIHRNQGANGRRSSCKCRTSNGCWSYLGLGAKS